MTKPASTSVATPALHDTLLEATARLIAGGASAPWWRDGRQHHCAYCGIMMRRRGAKQVPTKATADHVIPVCHGGPALTLPACHACNAAKGALSLPEFLASSHFRAVRAARRHGKAWPEHELWAAHAVAALRKTHELMRVADAATARRRGTAEQGGAQPLVPARCAKRAQTSS